MFVLVGGAIACNLIAALNYHRDPNGLPVFYLLSVVGLAVWLGMGLDALASRVRPAVSIPISALVVALVLVSHYEESDRSEKLGRRPLWPRTLLADLPEGAILITEGDDASFCAGLLGADRGVAPRCDLVQPHGTGDGCTRLERVRTAAVKAGATALAARGGIGSGRAALFYFVPRRSPISGWVFVPAGLVYRLQAPDDSTGAAPQIEMGNALAAGFFRDPWVRKIQSNYYFMAGEERLWAGDRAGATAAYEQAAALRFRLAHGAL